MKDSTFLYEKLGAEANIVGGPGRYGAVLHAAQCLSAPVRECAYGTLGIHTNPDGERFYVHAGGAIGASDVRTRLDPCLEPYRLPAVPDDCSAVTEAVLHVLAFLELAPDEITFALLGYAIRSLTVSIAPLQTSAYLVGETGSHKTSLVVALMYLFGPAWEDKSLQSFTSTSNYLESVMHWAGDVVLVVDDFLRTAARRGLDVEDVAERVIRGMGNGASRGRSSADGSARPSLPPRCGLIVTGEHLPQGHSLIGRLTVLPTVKGQVRLERLSAWRTKDELPSIATTAFIAEFLLEAYDELVVALPREVRRHRDTTFAACTAHSRTPSNLAEIFYGLVMFFEFALTCGAIDEGKRADLLERGRLALLRVGAQQRLQVGEADPCEIFLDVLRSVLAQGVVVLELIGVGSVSNPRGRPVVGWAELHSSDPILLDDAAAFRFVNGELRSSGRAVLPSLPSLRKALISKGIAHEGQANRGGRSQFTTPDGVRVDVLRIERDAILGAAGPHSSWLVAAPEAQEEPDGV